MDEQAPQFIIDAEGKRLLDQYYASPDSAPEVLDVVLKFSISAGASDIILEPYGENGSVRARIDGVLYPVTMIPAEIYAAVVSRLKVIAGLDVTIHSNSQEGTILYAYEGRNITFRLAIAGVVTGELVVLRLHDSSTAVYPLEQLGLQAANLQDVQRLLRYQSGLILTCGPTGSGKTSTLYSSLQQLNNGSAHIISVEDPVEYRLTGVNQMQIDKERGMAIADGVKVMLRLNPDVIFVGEIRDPQTAHLAIESAQTGHLVLSTLHTNSAVGTIFRLLDLGIEKYFINASLAGIVSQRLVRRVCPDCAVDAAPSEEEALYFQKVTGRVLASQSVGQGCAKCSMTGYKGRLGLYEVLVMDDGIKALISRDATESQISAALAARGFLTVSVDGMAKVEQRLTTVKEVMANVYMG